MGLSEQEKKQQRRGLLERKRQATFVTQYVQTKYRHIYREAAAMYNNLNTLHPHQPNLTKSLEFKNWQRRINGLPEDRYHRERNPVNNLTYRNMFEETASVRNDENDQSETTNDHPNEEYDQSETTNTVIPENSDTTNPTVDAIIQACPKKVMCLEIPLIDVPPKQPSEKTTQAEVHEETIDQGQANRDNFNDIDPSILDVLPQEAIDEMIYQLRQDKGLAAIMDNMDIAMDVVVGSSTNQENPQHDVDVEIGSSTNQENPQHDEFGLDIDIDFEEDRFENELNNIIW